MLEENVKSKISFINLVFLMSWRYTYTLYNSWHSGRNIENGKRYLLVRSAPFWPRIYRSRSHTKLDSFSRFASPPFTYFDNSPNPPHLQVSAFWFTLPFIYILRPLLHVVHLFRTHSNCTAAFWSIQLVYMHRSQFAHIF